MRGTEYGVVPVYFPRPTATSPWGRDDADCFVVIESERS